MKEMNSGREVKMEEGDTAAKVGLWMGVG